MLRKIGQRSAWLLGVLAAAAVGLLMLTVVANTASRFLFATPIPGANDYSRYWWMILIVFGALGLAETRNEHIEALVLENLMPPRLKILWRYIRAGVITATLTLFLIAAIPDAGRRLSQREYAPGSEIVIWPTRYIVVLGVAVFLVATLIRVFDDRHEVPRETSEVEPPEKSEPPEK